MRIIMETVFGSHLYGLDTPGSDRDFKGIYLPNKRDVLLGRIPRSVSSGTKKGNETRNTSADTDRELYSLHYFLELACEGQTVALDMLHAEPHHLVQGSLLWDALRDERRRFYTRSLTSLAGYARHQAAKYGLKGGRLASARQVLDVLLAADPNARMEDIRDRLPLTTAHVHVGEFYEVCGKKFLWRSHVHHCVETLRVFVDAFGHRAKLAERNEGVDWKAISHAYRAGFQCRAIFQHGDYRYPLEETPTLRRLKAGEIPAIEALGDLEYLMDEVEALAQASTLPAKVDRAYWDDWLIRALVDHGY